jgi:hypothetical protein
MIKLSYSSFISCESLHTLNHIKHSSNKKTAKMNNNQMAGVLCSARAIGAASSSLLLAKP